MRAYLAKGDGGSANFEERAATVLLS